MDVQITHAIVQLFVVIMSVTCHEFGHAWMANRLGDDTAARMGRLTLNPIPLMQAHPMSMVLLPLIGVFAGFMFAYASTPVSLHRVNRKWSMRQADFLITAAGPVMNFALALLGIGIVAIGFHGHVGEEWQQPLMIFGMAILQVNLVLFFFNLLPVPPLDGFSVLFSLLPRHFDSVRQQMEQMGFFLFLIIFLVGGRIISPAVVATARWLLSLVGISAG